MLVTEQAGYAVNDTWLVSDINLTLMPGRLAVIIGPNGAGKSTLLRLLTGELKPSQGSVRVNGQNLNAYAPAELSKLRAVVPQHTILAFPFTVIEVV